MFNRRGRVEGHCQIYLPEPWQRDRGENGTVVGNLPRGLEALRVAGDGGVWQRSSGGAGAHGEWCKPEGKKGMKSMVDAARAHVR